MLKKEIKKKWLRFIGNIFIVTLVNILCKTLRIVEINKPSISNLEKNKNNFVFAFWHGTMLIPWYALRIFTPNTIISKSRDGDLLVKVIEKWGYNIKRGSSSKGGKEVLDELVLEALNHESIAITPDGPRGPSRQMKAGGVIISKKAHIPIVLIGVGYKRKIILKSWDSFEIPIFFSQVRLIYSDPIIVEKNLDFEETDRLINQLGEDLNLIQQKAEKLC